jgi:hypothetical protein
MTLFSALLGSRGGAAGAGLGFLFLTLLASIWPAASQYSFVGLPGAAGAALTATPDFAWPVATAALTATAFTAAAIWIFRRLEI